MQMLRMPENHLNQRPLLVVKLGNTFADIAKKEGIFEAWVAHGLREGSANKAQTPNILHIVTRRQSLLKRFSQWVSQREEAN